MTPKDYARKDYCVICKKQVEIKEEKKGSDHDEIVLTCGHTRRLFKRSHMEHIPISDSVTARIIRFNTEEDRMNGFYELLLSKSQFRGIDKNKFEVNEEQRKLLSDKRIKYTDVK
jgi:hypothetical protein